MKKILIAGLLILVACGVVILLPDHSPGTIYPRDTVTKAIDSGATAIGASVMEHRTISGSLGTAGLLGGIRDLFRSLTRQDPKPDMDELTVFRGKDKATVEILSRSAKVVEVSMHSSTRGSKLPADLRTEIIKSLPGIEVQP